jgi:hypothetical protein
MYKCNLFGAADGLARLRAELWRALTVHRTVIHSAPFKSHFYVWCKSMKNALFLQSAIFLVRPMGLARLRAELWRALTVTRTVIHSAPFKSHFYVWCKSMKNALFLQSAIFLVRPMGLDLGELCRQSDCSLAPPSPFL